MLIEVFVVDSAGGIVGAASIIVVERGWVLGAKRMGSRVDRPMGCSWGWMRRRVRRLESLVRLVFLLAGVMLSLVMTDRAFGAD